MTECSPVSGVKVPVGSRFYWGKKRIRLDPKTATSIVGSGFGEFSARRVALMVEFKTASDWLRVRRSAVSEHGNVACEIVLPDGVAIGFSTAAIAKGGRVFLTVLERPRLARSGLEVS